MNNDTDRDSLLTAYALRELSDSDQTALERDLESDPQARQTVDEVSRLAAAVFEARGGTPAETPSKALHAVVVARLGETEAGQSALSVAHPLESKWRRHRLWISVAIAVCLVLVAFPIGSAIRRRMLVPEIAKMDAAFAEAESHLKKGIV